MQRDGYRCRYCGTPVVSKHAQNRLHQLLPPRRFPLGKTNLGRHCIRLALTATMDHVEPYQAGGDSTEANLVTACWCCNYGKGARTLEELLLHDPRARPPIVDDWDGGMAASP